MITDNKRKKIILLFPPVFQPFQPYLSLPSLTAFLKREGYKVIQKDINIEAYETLLTKKMLQRSYKNILKRFIELRYKKPLSFNEQKEYLLLLKVISNAPYIINNIEKFKDVLRDQKKLCNVKKYKIAIEIISQALALLSLEFYPTEFTFKKYIMKYHFHSTEDIIKATNDEKTNLFLNYFKEYVISDIIAQKPDLVGISIVGDYQIIPGFTLASLIKQKLPKVHITVGGPIFTFAADEIKSNKKLFSIVDSFIIHEGETALLRLAEQIENGKEFSKVPNLIYHKKGKIYYNSIFTEGINSLPAPCYDSLPLNLYLSPRPVLSILPARSCYWRRCAFCNSFKIFPKYNVRRTELIIKDIRYLEKRYQTKYFAFVNESLSPKQMREISYAIIQNKLDIKWYGGTRFDAGFDYRLCKLIKKAGCRLLLFGLESGCQRVLDSMEKGYKKEIIQNILNHCHKGKLAIDLYCLIGFPTETIEEAKETLDFILNNKKIFKSVVFNWQISAFALEKNTKVANCPADYGVRIIDKKNNNLNLMYQYKTKIGMSMEEAAKISSYIDNELSRSFNTSPVHFYHKIFLL